MKRWTRRLLRLIDIPYAAVLPLIAVSAALLIYVFATGRGNTALAYAAYPLSAYALTTAVWKAIPLPRRVLSAARGNRHISRYMDSRELRIRLSMRLSLGINIAYAALKCGEGWYFRSAWFGAVGTYYLLLSIIRFLLVRSDSALKKLKNPAQIHRRAWRSYRSCGALLLAMNIIMAAMMVHTVYRNEAFVYPGILIYASAAYTFYRLTAAIVSAVRYRDAKAPVLSAAKFTDMCVSLMSLYALQSAMIATFGSSGQFRLIMNSITGAVVCLWVIWIGVYMLVQARKKGDCV